MTFELFSPLGTMSKLLKNHCKTIICIFNVEEEQQNLWAKIEMNCYHF